MTSHHSRVPWRCCRQLRGPPVLALRPQVAPFPQAQAWVSWGWVLAALQGHVGDTYSGGLTALNSLCPVHAATAEGRGDGVLTLWGCRPEAWARGYVGCGRKPVQPDANLETPREPDANLWELQAP